MKKRNRKNIRKRKLDDDDIDDDTDASLLADIRKEQKERKKTLKALHDGSVRKLVIKDLEEDDLEPAEDLTPDDLDDDETATRKEEARRKLERMLDGQFTGQIDDGQGLTPHEKLMEQYINDKLGIKEDEDNKVKAKKRNKRRDEDAELYVMPEEMKEIVANAVPKNPEEVDFGGATIAWNTGIAEVTLPLEYKMKNVEETELTKQELARQRASAGGRLNTHPMAKFNRGTTVNSAAGNVTANYQVHRKNYAIMMRSREQNRFGDKGKGKGMGGGGGGGGGNKSTYNRDRNFSSSSNPSNPIIAPRGPKQQGQSSDDHLLNRFRKSWKR